MEREERGSRHIAFFLDHLRGGGLQKTWLIVAGEMAERGYRVDLVLCQVEGPLLAQVPRQVRIVALSPSSWSRAGRELVAASLRGAGPWLEALLVLSRASATLPYFPDLARYLRNERPEALYTATPHMNIEAALARKRAGVATRLIASEHNTLAPGHPLARGLSRFYLPALLRRIYSLVDRVVAVSDGVAADVASRTGLPQQKITTIYNPAVTPQLGSRASEHLDHPWFEPGAPPVILGAGRLGTAKDFPNLIRAFARVRQHRPVRLLILGEAKHAGKTAKRREQLRALAEALGVAADVDLPGFVQNPYQYMARAGVFVLSSRYEGLSNVLIEALASGCPVVSTDCPSGPREVLDNGRYGPLVPVGDDAALARAILSVLDHPPSRDLLLERAAAFTVERSVDCYEALLPGAR